MGYESALVGVSVVESLEEYLSNKFDDELFLGTEALADTLYAVCEVDPLQISAVEKLMTLLVNTDETPDEGTPEWLMRRPVVQKCRQLALLLGALADVIEQPLPNATKVSPGTPVHEYTVVLEKTTVQKAKIRFSTAFPQLLTQQLTRKALNDNGIAWISGSTTVDYEIQTEEILYC